MTQQEIENRVNGVVVQTLGCEEEEVKPSSHLVKDLGAESIDFLDLTFRLEREFGIKIQREELFPESIFVADLAYIKDGKITDAGIAHLKQSLPYVNGFSKVEEQRTVDSVNELFTVGLIYNFINWKLKL